MATKRTLVFLASISLLSLSVTAEQSDTENDFRFISHQDLMAAGSERFSDDGVTSYSQLLFDVARNQVFVGAKDNLYRLSLGNLEQLEKAPWLAPDDKMSLCQDKGQSENDCHNYIKVLLTDGQKLFTCGTNAYSPQCSWRKLDNVNTVLDWIEGVAKCPYNPNANITALMTMSGQYYVGSPTDFSGSDTAIYRDLGLPSEGGYTLRTNQYNSKWLNEPQFVGSFENDQFVFFVFREAAVEYINCGKRIYSRIARVCKNDAGGKLMLRDNWTTFVKARLNCSMPGEYPFYYDEVHGIDYIPDKGLLYATFTTPSNGIAGSAICVFNMSSIEEAFRGPFKHQDNPGSAWESRHANHQQHTHCKVAGSRSQVTDSSRYQLMDYAIKASSAQPLHTTDLERYNHITAAIIASVHVLFVATDTGYVKKITILPGSEQACVFEIWKPEMNNIISPIKTMQYLKETDSVYIGTESTVIRVPASRCGRHVSRTSCLGAHDPLCGWEERRQVCSSPPAEIRTHWIQGPAACPNNTSPLDGGWSSWSAWEPCLQKNDNFNEHERGEESQDKCQCQTRQCNNPAPRNGGKLCQGLSVSVANCTVHGGWTEWSSWSVCSASCGVAYKWRMRTCGAPPPAHGGRLCVGQDRTEIYCTQNPPCPAPVPLLGEGGWSTWDAWSECSAPCGGGARWRHRRCDSPPPDPGALPCPGCSTEAEVCNRQACESKRVSSWTPWLAVPSNITDTGFTEKRFKFSCKAQTSEPIRISMSKEEERFCQGDGSCGPTPESSAGWSKWGDWDTCSVECGGGYQTANRACLRQHCEGSSKMQRACNTHSCIDGWGCWSDWTPCSSTCGIGRTERKRSCLAPRSCEGEDHQVKHCEESPCLSVFGWSKWSAWSDCNLNDDQSRHRTCLLKNGDPNGCHGPEQESRKCNDSDMDNDLNALPGRGPSIVTLATSQSSAIVGASLGVGGTVGVTIAAFLAGAILALIISAIMKSRIRRRSPRVPSSPHYMSQQNSYVSVPLKEVPKKRQPSFNGIRSSTGALTLSKTNNINSDRNNGPLGTPKLYPKAIAGDYESATMKRNSNGTCRNNLDLEQEKFY